MITPDRIAAYAYGAGVRGPKNLAIAVAVALAESGGRERAHNSRPPDDSYGLWQINLLGSLRAPRMAQFGLRTPEDLFDPAVNARAMAAISNKGTNWRPWTTYTRGRYLLFMPVAVAAVAAAPLGAVGNTIGEGAEAAGEAAGGVIDTAAGVADAARSAASSVVKARDWIADRNNWIRVLKVVAGGGVMLVGMSKLISIGPTTVAGKVVKVASNVVPVGKAGKAAGKVGKVAA